ncbi:MAG: pseudouridine synthase [Chloroflexota bacterium]|nr:pseudouridine synthase [Chloroflexota bacterium]
MIVLRFWKPYDVLTQFTDADGRPTLADYIDVPDVYAAGRLDRDSEGLLVLTDSGWLNARLTQPQYAHPRTYWAQVERVPDDAALQRLGAGVELSDGWTLPASVRLMQPPDIPDRPVPIRYRANVPTAWLELTLTEGRNRQVRRMTAAVGHPTLRLVRWSLGEGENAITLGGLQPGAWARLSDKHVAALKKTFR